MFFLNLVPEVIRTASRRFYLGQKLDQIALNRTYVLELIAERQQELRKLDAEEALTQHELAMLP